MKVGNDGNLPAAGLNSAIELMDEVRAQAERATPLSFVRTPKDIANGILYLCSDASRFVTGTELIIDGGTFAG
jgi:NAD(P)-dependent dehydrogenase (short-subunit alcohol dehydrogenase family)